MYIVYRFFNVPKIVSQLRKATGLTHVDTTQRHSSFMAFATLAAHLSSASCPWCPAAPQRQALLKLAFHVIANNPCSSWPRTSVKNWQVEEPNVRICKERNLSHCKHSSNSNLWRSQGTSLLNQGRFVLWSCSAKVVHTSCSQSLETCLLLMHFHLAH